MAEDNQATFGFPRVGNAFEPCLGGAHDIAGIFVSVRGRPSRNGSSFRRSANSSNGISRSSRGSGQAVLPPFSFCVALFSLARVPARNRASALGPFPDAAQPDRIPSRRRLRHQRRPRHRNARLPLELPLHVHGAEQTSPAEDRRALDGHPGAARHAAPLFQRHPTAVAVGEITHVDPRMRQTRPRRQRHPVQRDPTTEGRPCIASAKTYTYMSSTRRTPHASTGRTPSAARVLARSGRSETGRAAVGSEPRRQIDDAAEFVAVAARGPARRAA